MLYGTHSLVHINLGKLPSGLLSTEHTQHVRKSACSIHVDSMYVRTYVHMCRTLLAFLMDACMGSGYQLSNYLCLVIPRSCSLGINKS